MKGLTGDRRKGLERAFGCLKRGTKKIESENKDGAATQNTNKPSGNEGAMGLRRGWTLMTLTPTNSFCSLFT